MTSFIKTTLVLVVFLFTVLIISDALVPGTAHKVGTLARELIKGKDEPAQKANYFDKYDEPKVSTHVDPWDNYQPIETVNKAEWIDQANKDMKARQDSRQQAELIADAVVDEQEARDKEKPRP